MNPNQVYYSTNNSGPGKGRRLLVVFGLVVVVAAAIGFFLWTGRSKSNDTTTKKTGNQPAASQILPIGVASSPTLVAPPHMENYNRQSNFVASIGDYTTRDNACNMQFGVVSSSELPGTTPRQIASAHLGASAEYGAVGSELTVGADLVLKANAGSQRYSIPTYNFAYSREGVNYLASYSIAILPGNSRAYVRTYCANTGEPVSQAAFKKINTKAKEITVKTE